MIKVSLPSTVSSGGIALAKDIIFQRRGQYAFALSHIMADATVVFEEVPMPSPSGGEVGCGVYAITGDLHLYQRNGAAAASLINHEGAVFEMHILFSNLNCLSTTPLDSAGKVLKPTAATLARFPLVADAREFFGVTFAAIDEAVSSRELRFTLGGSTAEKHHWTVTKTAQFYNKFELFPVDETIGTGD